MSEYLRLKIYLHCDSIKKGKPCSCEAIQSRYVEEAVKIVKTSGLKTYIEELSPKWKTLWIYKDEYMLEVIKLLPEQPKTIYDHWVLGKAFGYSDEAIKEFLETKVCNK